MKDIYMEQLVKRKNTKRTLLLKILLIVGAVATLPTIVFSPFFIFAPVILAGLAVTYFKATNVEYEYSYFNGNLDIDQIMAKQYRKRLVSINMDEIDVVAPTGSLEIQQYRRLKKYNYSSRRKGIPTYQIAIHHKGKRARIVFEPKEELLTEMKLAAPRKVFFY